MTSATVLAAIAAVVILTTAVATAQDHAALVEDGRAAFTRIGCSNCHTVHGIGTAIAPDLSKVGTKHDSAYLERWLRDPREVHPSGHMPALELTEADIRALAAFLAAQH